MATNTAPPSTSHRFFAWMRSLNIQREPGWLGGVASGIATRLGIDPLIVRGIIVVVAILGGPALLVYAAAWLLLPDLDDKIHLERVLKGELEPPIAGIGVLVLLSLLPVSQGFWFAGSAVWGAPDWGSGIGRALWTLVILGLAVWLVVWIARRPGTVHTSWQSKTASPPPPPASAPAADFTAWREQQAAWKQENATYRQQQNAERAATYRSMHDEQRAAYEKRTAALRERNRRSQPNTLFTVLVIGLSLVVGGLTALVVGGGDLDSGAVIAGLATLLAVLALGMLVNGIRGKRAGGAAGLAWLVVLPLIVLSVFPQNVHVNFTRELTFLAPVDSAGDAPVVYVTGGGHIDVDLEDYYPEGAGLLTAAEGERAKSATEVDDIYLFVVSGDVTVSLPDSYQTGVEAWAPDGVRAGQPLEDSPFEDEGSTYTGSWSPELYVDDEHKVVLHVFVFDGTITISTPKEQNS